MNNLLDIVNLWAERLTIRVLSIFGASETSIAAVKNAFIKKNESVSDSDTDLNKAFQERKAGFNWIKYLIYSVLIGLVLFVGVKIKNLIRK